MKIFKTLALLLCCAQFCCGILRAEEGILLKEGFENPMGDGIYSAIPKGWSWYGGWGKIKGTEKSCGIGTDAAAEGKRSLQFSVPPEGVVEGWAFKEMPRPENGQGMQISFKTKVSSDMQGLVLRVFVTWHDQEGKYIGVGHTEILTDLKPEDTFANHSFSVKPEQMPENGVKFKINVAAHRYSKAETFSGAIYVDDLVINTVAQ